MKLIRLVVSDLHLGTGVQSGRLNPHEDFFEDDRFAELLGHYDSEAGPDAEIELVLNGDIFDLLKVKIDGTWPTEITEEIAVEKLRLCLEGHPKAVLALRKFVSGGARRIVYLPGNHDLDMWFYGPQELFKRYVAPGELEERVRFITASDTYYLPEGIQIRHGHQLERIHRVDYSRMVRQHHDGRRILHLPYGSLWILEVLNPAKELRANVDRIQPLRLFILGSLFFDPRFAIRFLFRAGLHLLRRRVFTFRAWTERFRSLPRVLRDEVFEIGGYDAAATRYLQKLRGVHTLIVGHSHSPRFRVLSDSKVMVNTGTWMKMINLNLQYLGQDSGLTYALIEYPDEGSVRTRLMRWYGTNRPCEVIPYAY
jgi:UDP-2,3-diacylglucosamine pyrophosphatase LpxH